MIPPAHCYPPFPQCHHQLGVHPHSITHHHRSASLGVLQQFNTAPADVQLTATTASQTATHSNVTPPQHPPPMMRSPSPSVMSLTQQDVRQQLLQMGNSPINQQLINPQLQEYISPIGTPQPHIEPRKPETTSEGSPTRSTLILLCNYTNLAQM